MIKANELRIGNWINGIENYFGNGTPKPIQVDSIISDGDKIKVNLVIYEDGETNCAKDISPIPITDEIMLKCGFRRDGSYWANNTVNLPIMPTIYNTEMILVPNRSCAVMISSLHQLQNLYFALTGEELKIEL